MKLQLSLLAFMATAAPLFADGRRLEVLFLGDSGHHVPAERYPQLVRQLAPRGVNLTYSDNLDDLNTETLGHYDALAIYANWDKLGDRSREKAMVDFVKGGHGLVVLHCGSYCFRDSLPFVAMTGGQFLKHGTGEFDTKITAPEHPIMKGFKPFHTWDETYVHTAHNQDRTVLQMRDDEPWTWVRNEGKGRVFYTAYGHDYRTWSNPGFGDLVFRGINWAVGDAAAKLLTDLKIQEPRYVDDANRPVPNYEKRNPAPRLQEPLSAEQEAKHIQVPANTSLKLFASEKTATGLWNVIDFKFDERGRMWTCESLDYPNEIKPQGNGRDRIRILEDTNGDGVADKATVFADKLSIPSTLVFANGGIIVGALPDTVFLKDTNGDDKADEKKVLFTGWGTGDTHATVSNFRYGFDGWIWGTVGYSGFNGYVGGESLRFGQACFRFKPDGSKMEVVGRTSNNTWGLGMTENFDIVGSTANNQHAWYIAIPQRYHATVDGLDAGVTPGIESAESKWITINREYVRMVDVFQKQNSGDIQWGYTACAAQVPYTARSFPKEYWNRASFVCEPTAHVIGRGFLKQEGTNFVWTRGWNLLASDDEWTAPVQAEIGPDGAVWVSDFYSFLIQHNPTPNPERGGFRATTGKGNAFVSDLRDTEHARLWRLSWNGAEPKKVAGLKADNVSSLLGGLQDNVMNTRLHAQRLLVERGQKDVVPALSKMLDDTAVDGAGVSAGAQHAVWTLAGLGALDDVTVKTALAHPAQGVRRAALAAMPKTEASAAAIVASGALKDREPLVRLAALLALADCPPSEAAGTALAGLNNDPEVKKDRYLPVALTIAGAKHAVGYLTATLAAAPAVAGATAAPAEAAKNLLPNPGFEEGGDKPTGWAVRTYTGSAEHKVVDGGRNEGRCLQISSEKGADTSWFTDVTLEPDTDYLWSGYIKTDKLNTVAGAKGAMLEVHQLNGAQPYSRPPAKGTQDWTRVELKFSTGRQTNVSLNLLYGGWGPSTGTAMWDDVSLVKVGKSTGTVGGTADLAAIARTFAKHARPQEMGAIHTAIAAKSSAASQAIAQAMASTQTASAAPKESVESLAKTHQIVRVKSIEGLQFDVKELNAKAGQPIAVVFDNPDALQHNLVVGQPGSLEKIGNAANLMAADPQGAAKGYVPSVPDVIGSTGLLNLGEQGIVKIGALKPGDYPYLCTFPGHWILMKGVMKVR